MANTGDETSMVAIDVAALEMSMKTSLRTLGRMPKKDEPCTIFRVFHTFRRDSDQEKTSRTQDYTPQIISIGPFHHGNPQLAPMQPLKWRYFRQLIRHSSKHNTPVNYINAITKVKDQARNYYSEPIDIDDNNFVEMMVLDGCFLLEFLVKAYFGQNEEYLGEVNWNLPLIRSDLLLLENQYPFPILKVLFDASDIPLLAGIEGKPPVTLTNLVVSYITRNKLEVLPAKDEAEGPDSIHHMLHVLHATLRPKKSTSQKNYDRIYRKLTSITMAPFILILSCFLNCSVPLKCCGNRKIAPKDLRAPRGIPTASQLRDSGVEFIKKEDTDNILDVTFHKESGIMEIPRVAIQEGTLAQFRNLIAFEQCCPKVGTHCTAHATFMNHLIDSGADVALLKEKGIIESKLGQDEEVAELFNGLCKGSYLNFEKHYLLPVFKNVICYCNIDRHKWRAGLMHDYFGNPWATISLVAAVFLTILTVVQTFYTIYAYHHPSS